MPDPSRLSLLPERLGLPRGRAALPVEEVMASQRGRILQAVVDEVAERGWAATTVQHATTRARVSRTAFYEHFPDKQTAFLAAHAEASAQLLDLVRHTVAAAGDVAWPERLRAGVRGYLHGFESAPHYAVSFMVELRGAGTLLLDQRDRVFAQHAEAFAQLAERAAAEDPAVRRPTELETYGVIGAADELATRAIRAGELPDLSHLVEPIVAIQRAVLVRPEDHPAVAT